MKNLDINQEFLEVKYSSKQSDYLFESFCIDARTIRKDIIRT
jgi:hypothetical protein